MSADRDLDIVLTILGVWAYFLVNFGAKTFLPENIESVYEKLTKCPNFTWHLPEKLTKLPNFT